MDIRERQNHTAAITYSQRQRSIERIAVLAYGACIVALAVQIAPEVAPRIPLVAGAMLAGYLAADLLAGIVHWLADTYGSPHTPLVGPTLIYGFREHHDAPEKILQHDFVETNGAAAAAAIPVAALALTLSATAPAALFMKTALAALTLAVVATNQLHKWAHTTHPPTAVRVLQRLRLILRPEAHARHHTTPFRTHYCITTGWLNGPLERLRVFAEVEKAVAVLTKRNRSPTAT